MKDANNVFHTSYVALETSLILCDAFPDPIDNQGVIPGHNVKWFILYICA
jgi:hypothetical protein